MREREEKKVTPTSVSRCSGPRKCKNDDHFALMFRKRIHIHVHSHDLAMIFLPERASVYFLNYLCVYSLPMFWYRNSKLSLVLMIHVDENNSQLKNCEHTNEREATLCIFKWVWPASKGRTGEEMFWVIIHSILMSKIYSFEALKKSHDSNQQKTVKFLEQWIDFQEDTLN